MVSTKNISESKKQEKLARKFLRERNLLTSFNRFKRISPKRKKAIMIQQDGLSQNVLAFRRGNKVIIVDKFSLRTLATTKRFNLNQIESALQTRKLVKKMFGKKVFDTKISLLKLKELSRVPLTNVIQIERNAPLRKKVGRMFVSFTFTSEQNEVVTVEGGSQIVRTLISREDREKAFNEALNGAKSQLPFYNPKRTVVNWIHFSYFLPKKRVQPVIMEGKIKRAI